MWKGSDVQSLLFDTLEWTERRAKQWALRHGYIADKVHTTEDYIRIRQFNPTKGAPKRTIDFGKGIRAIVERR